MALSAKEKENILAAKELTELQVAQAIQLAKVTMLAPHGQNPAPEIMAALIQAMAVNYASITK